MNKKLVNQTSVVCADFETTTDPNDCRVWAWGLAYVDYPDNVEMDTDMASFIDRISDENLNCYFHNLKFDGTFLIDWLLKNGYTHTTHRRVLPGQFSTLISMMGAYYNISVHWKSGFKCEFRDSYKKLPFGVARIASVFGLDMKKGEIDYHAERHIGHVITPDEAEYVRNDVSIMAHAMGDVLAEGMTKLTVGADSLAEYKRIIGARAYERWFPVMSSDIDSEIRSAYRGGFTYADPRYKARLINGHGFVLDVNSLYPSVMYSKPIPFGEPKYHDSKPVLTPDYPLSIFQVTFTAVIKKDHIPCIQLKNNFKFSATEYLSRIDEPATISVTNVDWELYNAHYDITVVEYGPGYSFKAATGMFKDYIDKWAKVKATSKGGRRELAKLHLNSLYGKFATNPNITGKIPTLEDGRVKLVLGVSETRDPVYTAAGVFITAYARQITISAAQDNYASFAYADTDSLHLVTDVLPDIEIDDTRIGAWALEYEFDQAFFVRAKAYVERKTDGGYVTRVAGLPTKLSEKLRFPDMHNGKIVKGKLLPKNVPGGVVLVNVDYELKM